MLETILEPLQYAFMQRSLIVAVTVGVICAVVGSYLMVQRLALLGDAISHSVLPGLASAYLVGANIFFGAFIAGIISTVPIDLIGVTSSITRMYLSYYYNLPSRPAIVLVAFSIFVVALLFSPSQGLLTNPSTGFNQSALIKELKSLLDRQKL